MLIMCDNKGCLKSSNALFDKATKDVICEECGGTIDNISDAMKRTLKSFGQVIKTERKAFMLACGACKANREVVMDQDGNTICKICNGPITIHAAFKMAIEESSGGLERVNITKPKKKIKKRKISK